MRNSLSIVNDVIRKVADVKEKREASHPVVEKVSSIRDNVDILNSDDSSDLDCIHYNPKVDVHFQIVQACSS